MINQIFFNLLFSINKLSMIYNILNTQQEMGKQIWISDCCK